MQTKTKLGLARLVVTGGLMLGGCTAQEYQEFVDCIPPLAIIRETIGGGRGGDGRDNSKRESRERSLESTKENEELELRRYIAGLSKEEVDYFLKLNNKEATKYADRLVEKEKYDEAILFIKARHKIQKDIYNIMKKNIAASDEERLTPQQQKTVNKCINEGRYDVAILYLGRAASFNQKCRTR